MKTHVLFLLGLVFASSSATAQNTVGTIEYASDLALDGYNMVVPLFGKDAMLVDMCGEVVHTWESADTLRHATWSYLQANGDLVMTLRQANVANDVIWAGGGGGIIERRSWDNELLWSYTLNDSLYRLHHDIHVMENGNVLALAWELKDSVQYIAAGGDTALIDNALWSEMILELQPNAEGGADVVWEWHAWDHLVQDYDDTKPNYGVIADNPQKINLNSNTSQGQQPLADWLHMNSIHYDDFFGKIMVSVPNLNEIWILDHTGGAMGSILWRWGNPAAYDRGTAEDQKLFFQHDARWAYEGIDFSDPNYGKVTVFNNRVPDEEAPGGFHSEACVLEPLYDLYENEYAMDLNTGTYLPLDFADIYAAPNPADLASNITSNYQILPDGHSLIGEGNQGEAIELDENNSVVWRYKIPLTSTAINLPQPVAQGTVLNPMQNLMFRMERFASDFPGFTGQDLTPQGVIELDPMPVLACQIPGCTDPAACNYDAEANVDDGTCAELDAIDECGGDCFADNNDDGICDELIVVGCINMEACNYNIEANTDDGSCLVIGEACDDLDDMTINDVIDSTCACIGEAIVLGCLDSLACNYDMDANTDDGSCLVVGDSCDDGDKSTINDVIDANCECNGETDGIEETMMLSFALFPNPTTGEVTLQLNGLHPEVTVQVMDGAGRVVWVKPNISLEGATVFDLSTLSIGTYNVMLSDQRGISVQRLVIQR